MKSNYPYTDTRGVAPVGNLTLETADAPVVTMTSESGLWQLAYNYARKLAVTQPTVTVGDTVPESMVAGGVVIDAGMPVDSEDEAKDYFIHNCHDTEENARQLTPAGEWIHAVNKREDPEHSWVLMETAFNQAFSDEWENRHG